ncbi:MAG TPA: hypothetical protein VFO73_07000 [Candidatus Limnocylindrales bacterium]|nr:hypothetical protein [Candidatus Limnocylindrales bacterium]
MAPEPTLATTNGTDPATVTELSTICCGSLDPSSLTAAGPDHVAWAFDGQIVFGHRDLSAPVDLAFRDLFSLPLETKNFDPRMYFDANHQRWVAAEASYDCTAEGPASFGYGYLDIAFSDGPDPTKGWSAFYYMYIDYMPTDIGLGNSRDAFVVTTSVKAIVDSSCLLEENHGNEVLSFDWRSVSADPDAALSYWQYAPGPDWFRILVPALQYPATDPEAHLVSVAQRASGPNQIVHQTVNSSTGNIHSEFLTDTGVIREMLAPPPVLQESSSVHLQMRVFGPTSVVWQGERLVFASNDRCTPVGDDTVRACARISELDTSTVPATLVQDFLLGKDELHAYGPGLALTQVGDLHVTFTRSSESVLAEAVMVRQAGDDAGDTVSVETVFQHAASGFTGAKTSHYQQLAVDPIMPDTAWLLTQIRMYEMTQLSTSSGATYNPISPVRILDSRDGTGLSGAFAANAPRSFNVAGEATIPADAIAITGNVTVTGQSAAGYVSLTPSPTSTPTSSTLNFPLGDVRANNVTIPLNSDGDLSAVYKAGAGKTAHVIVDVTGYFLADDSGATYATVTPARILDSRTGTGVTGKFLASEPRSFPVWGAGGVPPDAVAVTGNLTITNQTKAGFVSLTPLEAANPTTSTLNFPLGDNRANGVTVPLSANGSLAAVYVAAAGGTADLLFDVTGYYVEGTSGLRFYPLNPARIMDTRSNALTQLFGAFTSSQPRTLVTGGHFGVPVDGLAVTGNLTVVGQTKAGFVAITKDPTATPGVSTLNFPVGDARANGVTVPLNAANDMALVYKAVAGAKTHLILDLTGYFR